MALAYALKVEADLSGNAFGTAPTWTDLSAYWLSTGEAGSATTVTGGRQDQVSTVAPSTFSVRLDNGDLPNDPGGRFSPDVSGLITNLLTPDQAAPGSVSRQVATLFIPSGGTTFALDTTGKTTGNTSSLKATIPAGTTVFSNPLSMAATSPVTAGLTYSASVQINNTAPISGAALEIIWLTNAGGFISTSIGSTVAPATTGTSTIVGVTAPAGAAFAQLYVLLTGSAPVANIIWYLGNWEIEQAATPALEKVQPYYSRIDVGIPIRISVTLAATTYRLAFGVAKMIEPKYVGAGNFAVTDITCTDILGRMGNLQALRDWFVEEALVLGATAMYPLQEIAGSTSFGDLSTSNLEPAKIRNGKQGSGVVTAGTATSMPFGTGVGINWPGVLNQASTLETNVKTLPAAGGFSVAICATWAQLATMPIFAEAVNGRTGTLFYLGKDGVAGTSVFFQLFDDAGHSASAQGPVVTNDGKMHSYVVTLSADRKTPALYIDGVALTTVTASGTALGAFTFDGPIQIGGYIDPLLNNPFSAIASGTYAFFSVFAATLTPAQALNLSNAALTAFAGEATGVHVARLLSYRKNYGSTIDAGVGIIGQQDIRGVSLQQALMDTVKAEAGYLYAAGDGSIKFYNRNRMFNPGVAFTLDASLEQTTADDTFPKSDQYVINEAIVTRQGGAEQRYLDATSQAKYGVYANSDTVFTNTDLQARDIAGWRVASGKTPKTTVPNLTHDLLTEPTSAVAASVLALTPLTRAKVTKLPKMSSDVDGVIQGWSYTIAIDQLRVALNLTPTPPAVMVWDGDAAHGWDTAAWGF